MRLTLKVFSLALLVASAVGLSGGVPSLAETGGYFTSEASWTHVNGSKVGTLHQNVFTSSVFPEAITCKTAEYTASVGGTKVTELAVTPEFKECSTTKNGYPVVVDLNGCLFQLTIGKEPEAKHQTLHLSCAGSNEVTLTVNPPFVGECWIHIPPQTSTSGGVLSKAIFSGSKHALELDVTASGITSNVTDKTFGCGGVSGENNSSSLTGTVVATGTDTEAEEVDITATGHPEETKHEEKTAHEEETEGTPGHFTSDAEWTHVTGTQEGGLHENVLLDDRLELGFTCETANYTANFFGTTVTEVTVIPAYANCELTHNGGQVSINMNSCSYILTIGFKPETKDQAVHLECPAGKEVTVSFNPPLVGECIIHIPPQTPTSGGVVYKTTVTNGKHSLTLEVTASGIKSNRTEVGAGPACLGGEIGESHATRLISKVPVQGFNTVGNGANITATGP